MGHCYSLALQDLVESIREVCRAGPLLCPPSSVPSHTVRVCVLRPQALCTSSSFAVRPVISILFWFWSLQTPLGTLVLPPRQWTIRQILFGLRYQGSPVLFIFKIFIWSHCVVGGTLVPQPGSEPTPLAVKGWSPNHRTTGHYQ